MRKRSWVRGEAERETTARSLASGMTLSTQSCFVCLKVKDFFFFFGKKKRVRTCSLFLFLRRREKKKKAQKTFSQTHPEHPRPLLLQVPVLLRSRIELLPELVGLVARGVGVDDGERRRRRGRRRGRRVVRGLFSSPSAAGGERGVEDGRHRQDAHVPRLLYPLLEQLVHEEVVGLPGAPRGQARGVEAEVEVHERRERPRAARGGAEPGDCRRRRRRGAAPCLRGGFLREEPRCVPHRRVGDDGSGRPHKDGRGRSGGRGRGRRRRRDGDADAARPPSLDDDLLHPRVQSHPPSKFLYPAHEGVDDGPGASHRVIKGGRDVRRRRGRRRRNRRRGLLRVVPL